MNESPLQSTLLDMLLVIDRICQKHAIPYQLAAGTLLGAVRDKDIIAWDKDADICMLRADYERFMAIAEKELDDRFFLQHHKSEPYMYSLVTRLRLNGSRCYYSTRIGDTGMHEGIWLDIFAFDDVKPYSFVGKLHMAFCALTIQLLVLRYVGDSGRIGPARKPLWLKAVAWLVYQPLRLPSKKHLMQWTYRLITWYSFRHDASPKSEDDSGFVTCLVSMPFAAKKRCPRIRKRADFTRLTRATIAGHSFPIPANYHEVLINLYGDYMSPPPMSERPSDILVEFDQSTKMYDKPAQS